MNSFPVELLEVAVTGCPNFVTQITLHNLSFLHLLAQRQRAVLASTQSST